MWMHQAIFKPHTTLKDQNLHTVVKWILLSPHANTPCIFPSLCFIQHLLHSVDGDNIYATKEPPTPLPIAVQREQRDSAETQAAFSRPGGKKDDLSRKAKAEARPPNEPHTANVGSAMAPPPGLRMAPVGREESENVANVQAPPKILQHAQPAQASDTGYGTASSKKKVDTGMYICPRWLHEVSVFMQSFLPIRCVKVS